MTQAEIEVLKAERDALLQQLEAESTVQYHLRAERDDLIRRLAAAEKVCLTYAWSPIRSETVTEKATAELWLLWSQLVGSEFLKRQAHPELSEAALAELAREREERRAAFVQSVFGQARGRCLVITGAVIAVAILAIALLAHITGR